MKYSKGLLLFGTVMLLFTFQWGCLEKPAGPTASEKEGVVVGALDRYREGGWENLSDPYAQGQVVAWLDSTPVTLEELERFSVRVMGGQVEGSAHGGGSGVDPVYDALPSFHRYYAAIKEAEKEGLHKERFFRQRFDLTVRTALAGTFTRWFTANAEVDPDSLAARIPKRWVQMNFAVKLLPEDGTAEDILARVSNREEFLALDTGMAPSSRELPQTGLVFPGSGFFEGWDDAELFNLAEGDVYGPIRTGIGSAIVLVLERQDMDEKAQADYMDGIREQLSQQWMADRMQRYIESLNMEIREDALEKAVFEEFTGGMLLDETVAMVGDDEISYRLFRLINGKSYATYRTNYPMSSWPNVVRSDLGATLRQVAVGRMAQEYYKDGRWPGDVPEYVLQLFYDYRKTFLYHSFLDLVERESQFELTDEELLAYYQQNPGFFTVPGSVEIAYKMAVDEETPAVWRKILAAGGSFSQAANATAGPKSPHGSTGEFKQVTVYQGDTFFKEMQEDLFAMEKGKTAIIDGEMGTYLVNVADKSEGRMQSFGESREEVRVRVVRQRFRNIVDARVTGLASHVKVRVAEEFLPAKPMEDVPHPDLG
ncbi:MAG: peptidyl-prolyl cis-trans isomerase [bacterium]|nr:peptidyl-prolyl cis-trans isomerase [bacterium]